MIKKKCYAAGLRFPLLFVLEFVHKRRYEVKGEVQPTNLRYDNHSLAQPLVTGFAPMIYCMAS